MNISEDVKLAIIIACNLLILKTDIVILNQMYIEGDCKSVGYLIYICTKIIKYEQMNILRLVFFLLQMRVGIGVL